MSVSYTHLDVYKRQVIYQQRNELLETEDISETITAMRHGVIAEIFRNHVPAESV